MRALVFSLFLAILAGLGAVAPAAAQPYGPPMFRAERYRSDAGRDGVQPLDRLLPQIRREHPGDFYDAEGPTYGPSGDPHYRLKWMTPDGRVIWLDTDARSGRVLRSSPGRDSFDGDRFRGNRFRDGPPPGYVPRGGYGGYGGGSFRNNDGPRFAPRYPRSNGDWRGGGRGGGRWRR